MTLGVLVSDAKAGKSISNMFSNGNLLSFHHLWCYEATFNEQVFSLKVKLSQQDMKKKTAGS